MVELAPLPTTHDEDWRYADPAALEALAANDLDVWHEVTLAPGETRSKNLILDEQHPGLHRVRIAEIDGARLRVRDLEALDGTPVLDLKPVLGGVGER